MSLSSATQAAQSSLAASQAQTALVSRNIANVNNADATRKYAHLVTGPGGGVQVGSVSRSANAVLFRNLLDATSSVQAWTVITEGMNRIDETMGDVEQERSPAAMIGKLKDALSSFAVSPNDSQQAAAAVGAAQNLAVTLNEASAVLQDIRIGAERELTAAAKSVNELLGRLQGLNEKIVQGTRVANGIDVTDFIDQRDNVVSELSQYMGVNTKLRGDNDMVVYTDSGVTLFETKARLVELVPGGAGNGSVFRVDGTPVTGENSPLPLKSGKVLGLVTLRDDIAGTYQRQLDEIARGLIEAFAEGDAESGVMRIPGLFTAKGLPELPLGEGQMDGLAGRIRISDHVNPVLGGNPMLLRDGVNSRVSSAYDYNPGDVSGFSGRLNQLLDSLDAERGFSPDARGRAQASLSAFATASVGWLHATRAAAGEELDYRSTLMDRTRETLSDRTGINLETEMTHLLDLERSYQASAKLLSAIQEMLDTLLDNIR